MEIELLNETLKTIASVEKETGEGTGFKANGSLFIARSDVITMSDFFHPYQLKFHVAYHIIAFFLNICFKLKEFE